MVGEVGNKANTAQLVVGVKVVAELGNLTFIFCTKKTCLVKTRKRMSNNDYKIIHKIAGIFPLCH